MEMESLETGEASSSREGGQRSAEGWESSIQGELQPQNRGRTPRMMRSTEGGDEPPIPEACSSVAPNVDGDVSMRSLGPLSQLKRPHDKEPTHGDQPPVHVPDWRSSAASPVGISTTATIWARTSRQLNSWFRERMEASVATAWKMQLQEKRISAQPSGTTTRRLAGRKRKRNKFLQH